MTRYATTFNQEILELDVEFNDNQSEIDMREMELCACFKRILLAS